MLEERKNPNIFLFDIVESIQKVKLHVAGMSKADFLKDIKTQDAVIRRLEIIGEAVKHISPHFKKKHIHILWQDIAGTRDILIHEYFGVDLDIVWDVVKHHLPILKKQITTLLKDAK